MQDMKNDGKTLKDLQKFPDMFTFKIIGENSHKFAADARKIFDDRDDVSFTENSSRTGKYLSLSVTTEVWRYEELEALYKAINSLEGLKFYV